MPSENRTSSGRANGHRPNGLGKGFFITLALLALAGGVFACWGPCRFSALSDPGLLWHKLGRPLVRTVFFVALGLLIGQVIEGLGWTRRLGALARPLLKRTHLPQEAGASFTAAFASGVTANAMLATSWQEGKLNNRQLVLANLLNASLPAFFLHLPTVLFVAYGILGWVALVYFGLTLAAALLRTLAVMVLSRIILERPLEPVDHPSPAAKELRAIFQDTWRKFLVRLRRLLLIILPVYLVVFLLSQSGFFTWLGQALANLVSSPVVPLEAMSVVIFAVAAEFTSGIAAAGALLSSGGLHWPEAVLALLIGNIAATPVRALRHQLPHYMGIYSPKLGAKLLAIGQSSRVLSVIVVAVIFAWWSIGG